MKVLVFLAAAITTAAPQAQPVNEARVSSVGLYSEIFDLILPGSTLEPKPIQQNTEIIVRITATRPHGNSFRYDLSYCGLEAGDFNLCNYLQRKDGTTSDGLPALPVRFDGTLPADRLKPNQPAPGQLPKVGGYRTLLITAGIIWSLCLFVLLLLNRKKPPQENPDPLRPQTLADRLYPLLRAARDGTLDTTGQAKLERSLLGFWRERLDLHGESPATALAKIRKHKDAAVLLEQFERWLHRPSPQSPVDLTALLEPYRSAIENTHDKD